ncbi:MAG: hypothetical protein N4A50_10235 [Vallitalea sp.]|jgi:hypothetical protein|nr:hypothetical protein [Vallitalea sp.]
MQTVYKEIKCQKKMCKEIQEHCNNDTFIITNTICGKIDLQDNNYHILWRAIDVNTSITIKISNKSKSTMKLKLDGNKKAIVKIYPNEETSITQQNVKLIAIQCSEINDERNCHGSYELCMHYISRFSKPCKNEYCFKNQVYTECSSMLL